MRHSGLVEALLPVKLARTLVFAVVAVALGSYIYLFERPRLEQESTEELLVRYDPTEVTAMTLRYPGEPPIAIVRRNGVWRLAEPVDTAADAATVDRLVEQVSQVKVERRIPRAEAQGLEAYGLSGDGERARVSISLADGTEIPDIIVGGTTPVGYSAFARLEGKDDIVVTPLIFHTGIKKTVLELRDKQLFPFDENAIEDIEVVGGGGTIHLRREGENWRLTSPLEDRADPGQAQTLLASVANMTALEYYDGASDLAAYGLDAPTLSIQLTANDGTVTGFRVGNATDNGPAGYYLERLDDGQVVKAPDWVATRFSTNPAEFRDKHLYFCDPNEVSKMAFIRTTGESFTLFEDESGEWKIDPAPPEGYSVRRAVVTRRRGGLVALTGSEIVAEGQGAVASATTYGLAPPQVTVELLLRSGESCGKAAGGLVDADPAEAKYYVMRESDGVVMTVPQYQYSRINGVRDDFLEPPAQPDEKQQ